MAGGFVGGGFVGMLDCFYMFLLYIYIHMESARKWFQRAMHDWIVFWPSTKKGGGLWVELLEYPAGWVANFLMSRRSSEGVAGRHGFAADLALTHKQPAGPETVPIKRTFLKKHVILPQCRADLMIGNPGKTWGAFFGFSASSLQRMHRYQLAVSILVNASPLPSSSIHHQEVTFGTQVAGNWLFHQIPLSAA